MLVSLAKSVGVLLTLFSTAGHAADGWIADPRCAVVIVKAADVPSRLFVSKDRVQALYDFEYGDRYEAVVAILRAWESLSEEALAQISINLLEAEHAGVASLTPDGVFNEVTDLPAILRTELALRALPQPGRTTTTGTMPFGAYRRLEIYVNYLLSKSDEKAIEAYLKGLNVKPEKSNRAAIVRYFRKFLNDLKPAAEYPTWDDVLKIYRLRMDHATFGDKDRRFATWSYHVFRFSLQGGIATNLWTPEFLLQEVGYRLGREVDAIADELSARIVAAPLNFAPDDKNERVKRMRSYQRSALEIAKLRGEIGQVVAGVRRQTSIKQFEIGLARQQLDGPGAKLDITASAAPPAVETIPAEPAPPPQVDPLAAFPDPLVSAHTAAWKTWFHQALFKPEDFEPFIGWWNGLEIETRNEFEHLFGRLSSQTNPDGLEDLFDANTLESTTFNLIGIRGTGTPEAWIYAGYGDNGFKIVGWQLAGDAGEKLLESARDWLDRTVPK